MTLRTKRANDVVVGVAVAVLAAVIIGAPALVWNASQMKTRLENLERLVAQLEASNAELSAKITDLLIELRTGQRVGQEEPLDHRTTLHEVNR